MGDAGIAPTLAADSGRPPDAPTNAVGASRQGWAGSPTATVRFR
ncbi:MAG: hypothetical protein OJF49_001197 [Ktedonobacterales bacterium]|nr:MAG: hypothetical protein OJF49_001197 [Ktedonobacterales bacterium]